MMKKNKLLLFLILVLLFYSNKVYALEKSIDDGTYIIKSALNNNMVIDVSGGLSRDKTNIQLYSFNNTNAQKWKVTYLEDGYYSIVSMLDNNMSMDVDGGLTYNRTNIQLYSSNGTNAQRWIIKSLGDGYYSIISSCNNLYIDVDNASSANGSNIQIYTGNGTKAQKFKFYQIDMGTQSIDDGIYSISSALNNNMVLDVNGGLSYDRTNIQLYTSNGTNAQRWKVTYLEDGFYSIVSMLDVNKAMDADGGIANNGTNIQLYSFNGSKAQRWIIKDLGDGYYSIVSSIDTSMYIDVDNAKSTNGTNIKLYTNNGNMAQKFKFNLIEYKSVENGVYNILPTINISQDINISDDSIQLGNIGNENSDKWYINKLDDGYYTILSGLNSSKSLGVLGNNISLTEYDDSDNCKWNIKYYSNSEFAIISKSSGLFLSIDSNNNIILANENGNLNQRFNFNITAINNRARTHSDGVYTISSLLSSNMVIDASGGYKINGTNIQLYSSNNTNAQHWNLKYLGDGYYSITSIMNPNVSLDVYNNGISNGINVQMYRYNGGNNQQWILKDLGNGYVSFVSKSSNLYLDVSDAKIVNGTNIQVYSGNDSNAQKFKLVEYNDDVIYTGMDVSRYQGIINWENVAKSNIGFVVISAGIGDNWLSQDDKKFKENVIGCEKYNIPYAIYLYSYAINLDGDTSIGADSQSISSEVEHTMRLLNDIKKSGYSPNMGTQVYIDMEEESTEYLGKEKLTLYAKSFCNSIEKNGYSCGIYANKTWFTKFLDAKDIANDYDIWLAEWNSFNSFSGSINSNPSYNLTNYKLWQFSAKGTVNGISGNVDLDLGYNIFK